MPSPVAFGFGRGAPKPTDSFSLTMIEGIWPEDAAVESIAVTVEHYRSIYPSAVARVEQLRGAEASLQSSMVGEDFEAMHARIHKLVANRESIAHGIERICYYGDLMVTECYDTQKALASVCEQYATAAEEYAMELKQAEAALEIALGKAKCAQIVTEAVKNAQHWSQKMLAEIPTVKAAPWATAAATPPPGETNRHVGAGKGHFKPAKGGGGTTEGGTNGTLSDNANRDGGTPAAPQGSGGEDKPGSLSENPHRPGEPKPQNGQTPGSPGHGSLPLSSLPSTGSGGGSGLGSPASGLTGLTSGGGLSGVKPPAGLQGLQPGSGLPQSAPMGMLSGAPGGAGASGGGASGGGGSVPRVPPPPVTLPAVTSTAAAPAAQGPSPAAGAGAFGANATPTQPVSSSPPASVPGGGAVGMAPMSAPGGAAAAPAAPVGPAPTASPGLSQGSLGPGGAAPGGGAGPVGAGAGAGAVGVSPAAFSLEGPAKLNEHAQLAVNTVKALAPAMAVVPGLAVAAAVVQAAGGIPQVVIATNEGAGYLPPGCYLPQNVLHAFVDLGSSEFDAKWFGWADPARILIDYVVWRSQTVGEPVELLGLASQVGVREEAKRLFTQAVPNVTPDAAAKPLTVDQGRNLHRLNVQSGQSRFYDSVRRASESVREMTAVRVTRAALALPEVAASRATSDAWALLRSGRDLTADQWAELRQEFAYQVKRAGAQRPGFMQGVQPGELVERYAESFKLVRAIEVLLEWQALPELAVEDILYAAHHAGVDVDEIHAQVLNETARV
ncbi:hypothetical protein [Mycobacterium avium]|uniref:hypothetical protein n=1 Tax=Mycobacterium avium TaxID=1764 RepID=UPI001140E5C3|nr:hypothetical protein [Mycobacterium avium]